MNIPDDLPIDVDLLNKKRMIPIKLAELSYSNPDAAIELLRQWGEMKTPITPLYEELVSLTSK